MVAIHTTETREGMKEEDIEGEESTTIPDEMTEEIIVQEMIIPKVLHREKRDKIIPEMRGPTRPKKVENQAMQKKIGRSQE